VFGYESKKRIVWKSQVNKLHFGEARLSSFSQSQDKKVHTYDLIFLSHDLSHSRSKPKFTVTPLCSSQCFYESYLNFSLTHPSYPKSPRQQSVSNIDLLLVLKILNTFNYIKVFFFENIYKSSFSAFGYILEKDLSINKSNNKQIKKQMIEGGYKVLKLGPSKGSHHIISY